MAKILLVEDNEMNRDMLSRRLVKRGYEVAIAVDGEQGVAMARSEAPALILMDMSLPGLDGWEATRQIKAAPETRAIPIVVITARDLSRDDHERLNGYVQKILQKGAHGRDQLLAEVRELVATRVARRRPMA